MGWAEARRVRAGGAANIEFLGQQPFEVLRDRLRRARAFVFAAEEDFGIAPLEAQACGTPVIAYGKGGALETIRPTGGADPTGLFFENQTAGSLVDAVGRFERESGLHPQRRVPTERAGIRRRAVSRAAWRVCSAPLASGRVSPQGPAAHIAVTSTPSPPISLGTRFVQGAWWSLIGMGAAQGLAVLASIVSARLLGKVTFGEFGMVTGTVGAFGMLAGLGLGLTATKFVAERRVTDPARAGHVLGLVVQVALISGARLHSSSLPPRPGLRQKP